LENGGKRVRPILALGAAQAVNPAVEAAALDYLGCAIEMLHTYSLVHDDLPAMDDDDLRRGRPSCHKAFDEATAILVGDGLQARAFELISLAPHMSAQQRLDIVRTLASGVGFSGMVGGQGMDIAAVNTAAPLDTLQTMHALKTGALIRASLVCGGIAAGANDLQLTALDSFGGHIGLTFQIVDDILDVTGDTATLGKTQGKDQQANKPTYVSLMGLAGAKEEAKRLHLAAMDSLDVFGESAELLRELADYIVNRSH